MTTFEFNWIFKRTDSGGPEAVAISATLVGISGFSPFGLLSGEPEQNHRHCQENYPGAGDITESIQLAGATRDFDQLGCAGRRDSHHQPSPVRVYQLQRI